VTEEERAVLYREQCAQRARFRAGLFARLAGDPAAATAVRESWAPLLPDPLDGWDCPCPLGPARPAWAPRVPGDIELPEYLNRSQR
jgi:hypothetical protein